MMYLSIVIDMQRAPFFAEMSNSMLRVAATTNSSRREPVPKYRGPVEQTSASKRDLHKPQRKGCRALDGDKATASRVLAERQHGSAPDVFGCSRPEEMQSCSHAVCNVKLLVYHTCFSEKVWNTVPCLRLAACPAST